jgi:hypothetical protein
VGRTPMGLAGPERYLVRLMATDMTHQISS